MKIGVDAEITHTMLPVAKLAAAVEDAGLESLVFMQCTHVPVASEERGEAGREEDMLLLDPLVATTVAAGATSRLLIGTGALYAGLYDPILLARTLATLDQVANGRILVGVTPGYSAALFRNHGIAFSARFRALREKCLAMRMLWTTPDAEFHGEFVDFEPVVLGLPPVQEPHPPLLIGSHGSNGLRRVVEFGDAWFPVMHSELDLEADMTELASLADAAGRPTPPTTAFLWSADERALERCATAGVERAVIALKPRDQATVDAFLERCAQLAAQLV